MIINKCEYLIASKEFPLKFYSDRGNEYDSFLEYSISYATRELAMAVLEKFDFPDDYQILKVGITYEF